MCASLVRHLFARCTACCVAHERVEREGRERERGQMAEGREQRAESREQRAAIGRFHLDSVGSVASPKKLERNRFHGCQTRSEIMMLRFGPHRFCRIPPFLVRVCEICARRKDTKSFRMNALSTSTVCSPHVEVLRFEEQIFDECRQRFHHESGDESERVTCHNGEQPGFQRVRWHDVSG